MKPGSHWDLTTFNTFAVRMMIYVLRTCDVDIMPVEKKQKNSHPSELIVDADYKN